MPFIGYLVLFNPTFIDYFAVRLPTSAEGAPWLLVEVHSLRLVFLYFGLLLLGTGILLYNGFAPEQIRRFPSVADYISEMEQVSSYALISSRFDNVVVRFERVNLGQRSHPMFGVQHPSFPSEPSAFLHKLVEGLYYDLDEELRPDPSNATSEAGDLHDSPYSFYTGSGYLLTDKIINVMSYGSKVNRLFEDSMKAGLPARSKEFFFLEHLSLDYSTFSIRLMIAVLFCLGLILLLVPTITTSGLVLLAARSLI